MKQLTFKFSKRKLEYIGYVFIILMFFINRYHVWNKNEKVEGIYLELDADNKEETVNFLWDFLHHDRLLFDTVVTGMYHVYNVIYDYNEIIYSQDLDYSLKRNNGSKIIVLVDPDHPEDFKIVTFLAFCFPYIIITIVVCAVWLLTLMVFFEKTNSFIFTFPRNKYY